MMEEIRRSPPGMYQRIVNHGVKYISTCTGFLSSTCSLMMFFIGSLMEVEFFWLLLRP